VQIGLHEQLPRTVDGSDPRWQMDLDQEKAMIDPQIVALHDAIEEGRVQEALDLLGSVPANARGVDGDSALHLACLYGHEQLVDLLLARGADVNAKDDSGSTPLHDASASGYESIVRTLLAKGAAVCVADEDGDTPLHNAANGNHCSITKMLLEAGADRTAENGDGDTPGMLARDDDVVALFN
jgi:ankyrin repeat protein